tara:strand:+ start:73975 stop:76152 length:2178 start_codon:yes stop_codon:yes gene_type:complete
MDFFTSLLESYSKQKKRTLKLLIEEEVVGDPQAQQDPMGQDPMMGEMSLTPEQEVFQDILTSMPRVYEGVDKKLLMGKPWEEYQMFTQFVTGGAASIENQIVAPKVKIQYNPMTKEYDTLPQMTNPRVSLIVSQNVRDIMEALAKDNIGENEKNKITSMLVVNSDGTVSILEDVTNSGLVFKDSMGFLKMIARAITLKFQIKIKRINVGLRTSPGIDEAIRALSLQDTLTVFNLIDTQKRLAQIAHPGAEAIGSSAGNLYSGIKQKLALVNQSYVQWQTTFESAALEPEDAQAIRNFSVLLDPIGGRETVGKVIKTSKRHIEARKPSFIITRKSGAGEGFMADTYEVYQNFEVAKQALVTMGFSEEDISTNSMVKSAPLELIFKDRPELLTLATHSEALLAGHPAFYTQSNIKHYLGIQKPILGVATLDNVSKFVAGVTTDPTNRFMLKYQEITGVKDINTVKAYSDSLQKIGADIGALASRVKTRNASTGNMQNVSPFTNFIGSMLDNLIANSSYNEVGDPLNANNDKYELVQLLKRYQHNHDEDDRKLLEDKIKQYCSVYLKNKKIIADIKKNVPEAKQYLAMKLFVAAGSADDATISEFRDIQTTESYSIGYNAILKDIISSFLFNSGEWDIRSTGNTFIFFNVQDTSLKVYLKDEICNNSLEGSRIYFTKIFCITDLKTLQKLSLDTGMETMMESYLSSQKAFLQRLFIKEVAVSKTQKVV